MIAREETEKQTRIPASPLVQAIANRLAVSGYDELDTPFKVASVNFEFTRVLRGRSGRSLDLIVVIDTLTGRHGDTDFAQVRRRVEALSRALDIVNSRLVLTVIIAGAASRRDVEALAETCRVLVVESIDVGTDGAPKNERAKQKLDDRIRLLLPLDIPPREDSEKSDLTSEDVLRAKLPKTVGRDFLESLLISSHSGEAAVQRELSRLIDVSLKIEGV